MRILLDECVPLQATGFKTGIAPDSAAGGEDSD